MRAYIYVLIILGALLHSSESLRAFSPALSSENTPFTTLSSGPSTAEVWINIFVHGIMSIKPHLSMSNFMRFMRDDIENTTYSKTVELMRCDSHFYQNQAMQEFGFKKIDLGDTQSGNASSAIASILNDVSHMSNGTSTENHYYTFGWSGLLSPTSRYKDAIILYKSIEQEVAHFTAQGITPHIRIFGYSHGGNVVLNLGAVRQKESVDKNLEIDEAILLGTPIQKETDYLVNDAVFKKVYNIFSGCDRVQKMDFFSFHRAFSRRVFTPRTNVTLPKKLVQIQLKITRLTPGARANEQKIKASFNFDSPAIISGKSHLLRDSSPGHGELWFFGWTPAHYRDNFALNPLPAVAITPFIVKAVQDIEHRLLPQNPLIVDIRPEHGVTFLKNVKHDVFYKIVDFIPKNDLTYLQAKARSYAPQSYTNEEYNNHVQKAYDHAHTIYREQWSLQARRRNYQNSRKRRRQERREARAARKTIAPSLSPSIP